jgi:histidinol-phosphate aminotransferase
MAVSRAKVGIERIKPHMIGGQTGPVPPASILLNSNESVFGASAVARQAARAAIAGIERYMENVDHILVPALAEHFELDATRITTGQGSDDLLARLARGYLGPGTELLRSANSYLKVPNYAHANDADVVSVEDDNFKPSVDALIAGITERTRIVYLANPENPAGTFLTGAEVRKLHAAMPDNALLVLDCAYQEYVDAPDYELGHVLVEEADNVVMCRTFSKIYGLAGARVGWMYGPEDVVDTVRRLALTFPIATPSVAAVIAAMDDVEHVRAVYGANLEGRKWLTDQLEAIRLEVIPSQTNFVLVHMPDPDFSAEACDRILRQQGIAIRRMAAPAYKDYIRITIGHPSDLRLVRDAIARFLTGES